MANKTRSIVLLAAIFCLAGCDWRYSDGSYYSRYQLSLNGGENSEADIFLYDLEDIYKTNDFSGFMKHFPALEDKFFVLFFTDECSRCEDSRPGFIEFERKFNKNKSFLSNIDKKEKFHLVTINFSEQIENDEYPWIAYFKRHSYFFNKAGEAARGSSYYQKEYLHESDVDALYNADEDNFLVPTILLIEFGQKAIQNNRRPGVTEVMFGVNGSTIEEKAKTLLDCWNHTGPFGVE